MAYRNRPGVGGYQTPSFGSGSTMQKVEVDQQALVRERQRKRQEELAKRLEAQNKENLRQEKLRIAAQNKPSTAQVQHATKINNINKAQSYNEYTDPFAINSISDAFFNREAKNIMFGQPDLLRPLQHDFFKSPADVMNSYIGRSTQAMVAFNKDKYLNPLMKGNGVKVVTNSLQALSEDMNMLTNMTVGAVAMSGMNDKTRRTMMATGAIAGAVTMAAITGGASLPFSLGSTLMGAIGGAGTTLFAGAVGTDRAMAIEGIKRGSGLAKGLGKTNFQLTKDNGEALGFFENTITRMALDPSMFISAAGNLTQNYTSGAMKNLNLKHAVTRMNSKPSIDELNQTATTLMDKIYVGTESFRRADRVMTKAVTRANPLGMTMYVATHHGSKVVDSVKRNAKYYTQDKAGYNAGTSQQNMSNMKRDLVQAHQPTDIASRHQLFAKNLSNKHGVAVVKGVEMSFDDLAELIASGENPLVESLYNPLEGYSEFAASLPKDYAPLKSSISEIMERHITAGHKGDVPLKLTLLELQNFFKNGVMSEEWSDKASEVLIESTRNMKDGMPPELIDAFIEDLIATDVIGYQMKDFAIRNADRMARELTRRLSRNSSKLEVFTEMEIELAEILENPPGTTMYESLAGLGALQMNITSEYEPIWQTMRDIQVRHSITEEDFLDMLSRNTMKLEEMVTTGGMKGMMSEVMANVDKVPVVPDMVNLKATMNVRTGMKYKPENDMAKIVRDLPEGLPPMLVPDYVTDQASFNHFQMMNSAAAGLITKTRAIAGSDAAARVHELLSEVPKAVLKQPDLNRDLYPAATEAYIADINSKVAQEIFESIDVGPLSTNHYGAPYVHTDRVYELAGYDTINKLSKAILKDPVKGLTDVSVAYSKLSKLVPEMIGLEDALESARPGILGLTSEYNKVAYLDFTINKFKRNWGLTIPEGFNNQHNYREIIKVMWQEVGKYEGMPDIRDKMTDEILSITQTVDALKDPGQSISKFAAAIDALDGRVDRTMASIPDHLRNRPDVAAIISEVNQGMHIMKHTGDQNYNNLPDLIRSEMPAQQYVRLHINKGHGILSFADAVYKHNPEIYNDLIVEHGPIAQTFEKIQNMYMGTTGFRLLQKSTEHICMKYRGTASILSLSADFTELNKQLAPKHNDYHTVGLDVLWQYGHKSPEWLRKQLLDTTSGVYRQVGNNLGMAGLDTQYSGVIIKKLVDYLDQAIYYKFERSVETPGTGFNLYVDDFLAYDVRDLFEGMQELDEELLEKSFSDLSEFVLNKTSRFKDLQEEVGKLSLDTTNFHVNLRKAQLSNPRFGVVDPGSANYEPERYEAKLTKQERRMVNFANDVKEAVSRSEGVTSNSVQHFATDEDALDEFSKLKGLIKNKVTIKHPKQIKTIDDVIQSRAAFTAKENLKLSNWGLLDSQHDYLEAITKLPENDVLNRPDGFDIVQRNIAEAISYMSPRDIAQLIKYDTNAEVILVERDIGLDMLSAEQMQGMAEYGVIVLDNPELLFYSIIKTDAPNSKYDSLPTPETLHTFEGSNSLGMHKSEAYDSYVALHNEAKKVVGVTTSRAADLHTSGRLNAERAMEAFDNNELLTPAFGGRDRVERLLEAIPRSRGFELDMIASKDFQAQFVSQDQSTGYSYLAGDMASSVYNMSRSLLHRNNIHQQVLTIYENDEAVASKVFADFNGDRQAILDSLNANPGQVVFGVNEKMKTFTVPIKTLADIDNMLEQDLMVTSEDTYNYIFDMVHDKKLFESDIIENMFKNLNKYGNLVYMMGQMTSFGALVRNAANSVMVNSLMTDSPMFFNRWLGIHKRLRDAEELSQSLKGITDDPKLTEQYFRDKYPDNAELRQRKMAEHYTYLEFEASSASIKPTKAKANRIFNGVDEDGNPVDSRFRDKGFILGVATGNPATKTLMTGYAWVHQASRYDMYVEGLKKGMDKISIVAMINETHFNYSTRPDWERFLNVINPFFTFSFKSLILWSELFYKSPILMRALVNSLVDPYTQDDYIAGKLAEDEAGYYDYMLMQGNPIAKRDGYTTIMKLNPTMFDALTYVPKKIMDPLGQLSKPLANMIQLGKNLASEDEETKLTDGMEIPFAPQLARLAKTFAVNAPEIYKWLTGAEDAEPGAHRRLAALVPSLASVNYYNAEDYKDLDYDTLDQFGNYRYGYKKGVTPEEWEAGVRPEGYVEIDYDELDERGLYKYGFKKGYSPEEWDAGKRPAGHQDVDFEKLDDHGWYQYGYKKGYSPAEWEAGVRPSNYKELDFDELDAAGRYLYGYKKGVTPEQWDAGIRPPGYKELDYDQLDKDGKYQYGYKKGVSPSEWAAGVRPEGYVPLDFSTLDDNGKYMYGYNKGKTPQEIQATRGNYGSRGWNQFGSGAGGRAYVPYQRKSYHYDSNNLPRMNKRKAYHPYQKFGAPDTYTAKGKGNRALSTGVMTKKGKYMASGGIGYGNAQYTRNNAMGMGFGRHGAYLYNAPQGVKLRRLDYHSRTLYAKQYSKSGNSRLINRTKTISDPKSLMFRLQDMRYNMF